MSDETTLLREKLNKLIIEIERLDIKLDSPAYDMTLGEYEQEREKLLDEFEQAIAATLGSVTLTAEQVREAIFHGSVYASYDGAQYYANGINMQAIADELNARAERTCEMDEDIGATQTLLTCSECGYTTRDYSPIFCGGCGAKVVDA